jgi:LmbE family N-acetylglucosaminyl deacetylase
VAAAREEELRAATRIIGIDDVHQLGHGDRALADVDPEDIRRMLVEHIRRYRPAVIVTFDPNGYNRHPDHVAISRFTSDAIAAAADPRWLPDTGAPHAVTRLLWTPPIAPWEAARSHDLRAEPGVDFLLDISAWRQTKAEALRAHRTQHQSVEKHFFSKPDVDRILSIEVYRHAWGPPLQARPSDNVFAGID